MLEERRSAKRFPAKIGMVFADSEGLNFSFITSISRSGIFLETEKILTPGSTIKFVLSNSVSKVPVEGEVVRAKNAVFEGGASGMGIRFENMDEMGKMIRDDILLYLMNYRYQQIWLNTAQAA